ncbi:hypothetical protein CC79DRAFT_1328792 [Sarocladium strictum]
MKVFAQVSAVLALLPLCQAHMEMSWPPPFRSRHNPYTSNVDYDLVNPLSSDGSNFPCKGYHSLVGTPQGQSVVTWTPGQNYNLTIIGSTTHGGGSCQASLSYDGGSTWTAIESFHGGCPLRADWAFTLPSDAPAGDALFAWTWFNRIGNREMYMNCARVTIKSKKRSVMPPGRRVKRELPQPGISARATSFSARPRMFVANVNNGCSTLETYDVKFPSPGPDVSGVSDRPAAPVGNCGASSGGGAPKPSTTSKTSTKTSAGGSKPTTSSKQPTATSNPSGGTAKLWAKCGGQGWTGATQCEAGAQCHRQDAWYSQCIPGAQQQNSKPTTSKASPTTTKKTSTVQQPKPTSGNSGQLAPVWGQCGGKSWTGPKACQAGLRCDRQSEWYSQCMPH